MAPSFLTEGAITIPLKLYDVFDGRAELRAYPGNRVFEVDPFGGACYA